MDIAHPEDQATTAAAAGGAPPLSRRAPGMLEPSRLPRAIVLGQPVQRRSDSIPRRGHIVAVTMTIPYQALVRWPGARPTFESLDDLIEVT
jgi:hypothetical protein